VILIASRYSPKFFSNFILWLFIQSSSNFKFGISFYIENLDDISVVGRKKKNLQLKANEFAIEMIAKKSNFQLLYLFHRK
jgi:hypothetical protein